ncbi:MAG: hypothetical protein EOM02_07795 [Synergistales bacterium]|nr:hypothetical protein [Synergistales bacterium]
MTTYRDLAAQLTGNTFESRLAFVGEWMAGDGTSCAERALSFPDAEPLDECDTDRMSEEWDRREEIRLTDEAHWAEWNQRAEANDRAYLAQFEE